MISNYTYIHLSYAFIRLIIFIILWKDQRNRKNRKNKKNRKNNRKKKKKNMKKKKNSKYNYRLKK